MKNIFASALLISSSILCFGQETFQFKVKFQAQSSYQTEMKTEMLSKMSDDENLIPGFESKMLMDFQLVTKTESSNQQGNLPFEINYSKLDTKMFVNGKELPNVSSEAQKSVLGLKLKGIENENGRTYLIEKSEIPAELKSSIDNMINSMSMLSFYPKETFKVGDSHEIIVPFKLSLQEGLNMELKINAIYKLTKLDSENAYFDIKMTSKGEILPTDQIKIVIDEYVLSGKMKVNKKDHNVIDAYYSGPMNMTMFVRSNKN